MYNFAEFIENLFFYLEDGKQYVKAKRAGVG
jgi:hypothetical protein